MEDTTQATTDVGWELEIRATIDAPLEDVWEYVIVDGVATWLGDTTLSLHKGDKYETTDGVTGEILSRTDQLRLRLTWRPDDWDHDSTVQISLTSTPAGTTIALNQTRLASEDEHEEMLAHWASVLEDVVTDLS